jgi:DNA-binding ferritin-like protein (Dps family)
MFKKGEYKKHLDLLLFALKLELGNDTVALQETKSYHEILELFETAVVETKEGK